MAVRNAQCRIGAVLLSIGALLSGASGAFGQAPLKTNLKKILVLDKSKHGANGHKESRVDLNKALAELGTANGFTVKTIGQNAAASEISSEFSVANLSTYQVVIFSNNDGVHEQLDATSKANLEAYVKNGGGLLPIHAASAGIANWAWITSMLVESFFGPHGNDGPTANMTHDAEGNKDATETKGIYKGLTAPLAFLDEYYSFRTSPRGKPGVTILLTIAENSFTKPVQGPMGNDHPVVWAKTEGKGRVVHFSVGHSWSTNNAYTAKNSYLKNFLYGNLRYAAGDFIGCMDNKFQEYSADVTKSDATACITPSVSILRPDGSDMVPLISKEAGKQFVNVTLPGTGSHSVTILDVSGRAVQLRTGVGASTYSLAVPSRSGIYMVVAKSGGKTTRHRVTVL